MFEQARALAGALLEQRRNAKLTTAAFKAAQLEKFRRLARHANAHADYYAQIIKDRGIDIESCVPSDFPVLTKSILMENFDRIVTDPRVTKQAISNFLAQSHDPTDRFLGRYRVIHTSGTSGEVGYFVFSPEDWTRGLATAFLQRRRRPRPKGLRRPPWRRMKMAFYGATDGHYAGVTMASAAMEGLAQLIAEVKIFEINRPIAETVADLNAFQPDALSGYTTALKNLAEKQHEGALRISPVIIGAAGEAVTKADVALLEEAFGAEAGSGYGCSEHLFMGWSDPGNETMTLPQNNLIYELHEDCTVVTNLFNYTEPLIRYRMSDVLEPVAVNSSSPCDLVIKTLAGRAEITPAFRTADGDKDTISPHTINEVFVPGVTRFQMRLTGETSFTFLAQLDPSLGEAGPGDAVAGLERRLTEILRDKGLSNVSFEIRIVDEIALDPRTRKFKLIVDERPAAA